MHSASVGSALIVCGIEWEAREKEPLTCHVKSEMSCPLFSGGILIDIMGPALQVVTQQHKLISQPACRQARGGGRGGSLSPLDRVLEGSSSMF